MVEIQTTEEKHIKWQNVAGNKAAGWRCAWSRRRQFVAKKWDAMFAFMDLLDRFKSSTSCTHDVWNVAMQTMNQTKNVKCKMKQCFSVKLQWKSKRNTHFCKSKYWDDDKDDDNDENNDDEQMQSCHFTREEFICCYEFIAHFFPHFYAGHELKFIHSD